MFEAVLTQADEEFKKAVDHVKNEYARLQIGRASATLVEAVQVESYGTMQPLKAVASIMIPDPKTVQIQPWDKSQLAAIEKAIQNADLNITPVNDGVVVRLNIPPLTEERRKDLTKVVHRLAEEARIAVRNGRQKAHDALRAMEKSGDLTEDQLRTAEKKLQEKVDAVNKTIEEMGKTKEQDVMTV